MTLATRTRSEIKTWLETLLKNENIDNLDFTILGNSEQGDGYIGDILFVEVCGTTKDETKNYNLVLKCSKRSQALREKSPVKEAFLSEIYFYDVVFPSFKKFQHERNITEPFEKVPKCYGTLTTGDTEVLALENLKNRGYFLWDKTKPLTRPYIDLIVKEYGKLHAVSIAMQDQEPENYKKLVSGLDDVLKRFFQASTEMYSSMGGAIVEIYELLKGELDERILEKWYELNEQVEPFFTKACEPLEGMNVITHGDCWCNNFMHYNKNGKPFTAAILDWQLMTHSPPIFDLSYFLFACLSEDDINDMDTILEYYYGFLIDHLEKLGSSKSLYPKEQFLEDWKKYNKFGLLMTPVIHKFCLSEKDDAPDMTAAAEKGEDILKVFVKPIKNIKKYKERMKYIVKYSVENNII
ncbi:hypothetical protein Zmor_023697 [Zophobas morio]|uniref:CHK kinase-like domain-containing protein n=1 Tax=Zophobas morio TaxID=2755281 RepID=A0AA38M7K1_9CUCU|nr:hypothetical protein Zmor_023697 [Zophobas morio]